MLAPFPDHWLHVRQLVRMQIILQHRVKILAISNAAADDDKAVGVNSDGKIFPLVF